MLEVAAAPGPDTVENTQGAVIQPRVAPQQKSPAFAIGQLVFDQVGKHFGPLLVPILDAIGVARR